MGFITRVSVIDLTLSVTVTSIAILWAMPSHWPEIFTHDDDDHQDVMKRDTLHYIGWMTHQEKPKKRAGCESAVVCPNSVYVVLFLISKVKVR